MDSRDPALLLDPSDPAIASLLSRASALTDLDAARAEKARLDAEIASTRAAAARTASWNAYLARAQPLVIGGSSGIDPAALDVRLERSPLFDGSDGFIAWVPVPIYPIPTPPSNPAKRASPFDGRPIFHLGETQIRESLCEIPVFCNRPNPSGTGFVRTLVSCTGFCRLELSPYTPAEVRTRLSSRDALPHSVGAFTDLHLRVDSGEDLADASSPASMIF
jgi:hypothetical protein